MKKATFLPDNVLTKRGTPSVALVAGAPHRKGGSLVRGRYRIPLLKSKHICIGLEDSS
jgi:hypothetical protein